MNLGMIGLGRMGCQHGETNSFAAGINACVQLVAQAGAEHLVRKRRRVIQGCVANFFTTAPVLRLWRSI